MSKTTIDIIGTPFTQYLFIINNTIPLAKYQMKSELNITLSFKILGRLNTEKFILDKLNVHFTFADF